LKRRKSKKEMKKGKKMGKRKGNREKNEQIHKLFIHKKEISWKEKVEKKKKRNNGKSVALSLE